MTTLATAEPFSNVQFTGVALTPGVYAMRVGYFIRIKYRAIALTRGYFHAAKLLRKQGYSLEIALAVLVRP